MINNRDCLGNVGTHSLRQPKLVTRILDLYFSQCYRWIMTTNYCIKNFTIFNSKSHYWHLRSSNKNILYITVLLNKTFRDVIAGLKWCMLILFSTEEHLFTPVYSQRPEIAISYKPSLLYRQILIQSWSFFRITCMAFSLEKEIHFSSTNSTVLMCWRQSQVNWSLK